ncbi:MAG: acetyl-CoA carboxylase biotin carboxylase subunit [Pseudomonadota bacterium]
MSIETILIANRGEIACRVIRSARALELRTVAVYSDADRGAAHAREADQAVHIGAAPVAESYLNSAAILRAAKDSGADAIHPGYGFLSENAEFAEAVEAAGLVFIGPSPHAIHVMGDKAGSKRAMIAAGVPCVPGYEGEDQSDARLIDEAAKIGFPVMVKASAGGGGRGMRLAANAADLPEALTRARAEALSAFGSDILIIEKAVQRPRHVEVQVFADNDGATVHLGERDCSVQRRHQKVLEEAPCPVMTPDLRARMGAAAVAAAEAVDYTGAGTVEFLLDDTGAFYFLEMNTRLQVEHPVTEMVTGLDLVALQIAVARGEALPFAQEDITLTGHAIEARLYAEDPAAGFLPSTGQIALWQPAAGPGIRIDSGIAEGGEVSPYYDPMLAKIIAHGASREEARRRLIAALEATALVGPVTNTGFLIDALRHEDFASGSATTAFIEESWPDGVAATPVSAEAVALGAALCLTADRDAALVAAGMVGRDQLGWQSDGRARAYLSLLIAEEPVEISAALSATGWAVTHGDAVFEVALTAPERAEINGRRHNYAARTLGGGTLALAMGAERVMIARAAPGARGEGEAASGRVTAPMPGVVVEVLASAGDTIAKGAPVAVLEAMKMQHRILAGIDGTLGAVEVAVGDQLRRGDLIAEIT